MPQNTISAANTQLKFPYAENLVYHITWRMVTAGQAAIKLTPTATKSGWDLNLDLQSLGLVNQLYRVQDSYKLSMNERFCGSTLNYEAQEGSHHTVTTMAFDSDRHKLTVTAKDMVANATHNSEFDIPPCTYDIAGALLTLRASQLQPGMKYTIPITNGKKLANIRVEGLGKEKVAIKGVNYNTIRYETFIFDGLLYRRKGRLLIWVTDDATRLPVQMRFVFGFPLGDITLDLEKVEKL